MGLIPAGAGNMYTFFMKSEPLRAHPRGCGEHLFLALFRVGAWGSSPRVREHRTHIAFVHLVEGSSPRVRGTWRNCYGAWIWYGLIPRVRGTYPSRTKTYFFGYLIPRVRGTYPNEPARHTRPGLIPRVRGTFGETLYADMPYGLIPAGAGNIAFPYVCRGCWKAHPRGCGEHEENSGGGGKTAGSSPRVRGTCVMCFWYHHGGLIPAGAGNIGW
ncbi:Domain of uncharacterised function (DUF2825) [Rothia dentocariosa]|uniref:Domain of uncharacterized function (DUF2825) n=1 Tax=Rothia dentocariosa TaxID=2047 RepID=A0A3S4ZLG6_9MICC|nr:Domain of uncharacterised function (DUF2825) [Rothia dentocariosa]